MTMKVFGIGLNKTGTTTLGVCLQQLGYRHTSFSLPLLEQVAIGELELLFATVASHDSFEDWPYPLAFEALDRRFPGSRFILTRRSTAERWLESLCAHALRTDPAIGPRARTLAYGWPYPQLDPAAHLQIYDSHLERVRGYFQQRPGALLEVCWEEQASWEDLCGFLQRQVPDQPFPHANASRPVDSSRLRHNESLLERFRALAVLRQRLPTRSSPARKASLGRLPELPW